MGGRLGAWSSWRDQAMSGRARDASASPQGGSESRAPGDGAPPPALRTGPNVRGWLILADAVAVTVGFGLAFVVQASAKPVPASVATEHLLLAVASLPVFAFGAASARLYRARNNERPRDEVANILRAVAIGVAALVTLAFGLQFKHLSRLWIALVGVGVAAAWIAERLVARRVLAEMRVTGRLSRRIVIVGTDSHAVRLLHTYQRNRRYGYDVIGFVGDGDLGSRGGVGVLGRMADLDRVLDEHQPTGVVISLYSVGDEDVNRLSRRLTDAGFHVALSTALTDIDVTRLRPQQVDGRTMIYVEPVIRHGWRALAKRAFDIAVASFTIVVTLPIWLLAMLAVRLTSRGPVFFRQQRVGRDGRLFTILKLRTMEQDAEAHRGALAPWNEASGPLFKIEDDPRLTPVGRWLRKFSIDELPQLLCVLRGDMSMVGPRPALPDEVAHWDDTLYDRLRVPPGLTGMWQVSGRADASFEQYRRLDLYYVDNWSLTHDIRICVKTLGAVVSGRGVA